MLPIRRYPRPLIWLCSQLFCFDSEFHTQRKWTYGPSCHNIFACEAECFAPTLRLHLLQNCSKIIPTSKRNYEETREDYYLPRLHYLLLLSTLLDAAFRLFNSVCPYFPSPFTPIMWLTPSKRINRWHESRGSLRIAECARPTTSPAPNRQGSDKFDKKRHIVWRTVQIRFDEKHSYYARFMLLKIFLIFCFITAILSVSLIVDIGEIKYLSD